MNLDQIFPQLIGTESNVEWDKGEEYTCRLSIQTPKIFMEVFSPKLQVQRKRGEKYEL